MMTYIVHGELINSSRGLGVHGGATMVTDKSEASSVRVKDCGMECSKASQSNGEPTAHCT